MNWFEKMKSGFKTGRKREIPAGIWSKCPQCSFSTYQQALERAHWICSECSFHYPVGHQYYVQLLTDEGTFTPLDDSLTAADPLRFRDTKRYTDRIRDGKKASELNEAVCTGIGRLGGEPLALGVMDTRFILGSLGSATGEKISRLIDRALAERSGLVLVCQSGGARMMESAYSLMQMAKISAKLHRLALARLPYIAVLTDPTYGGVTASFAMLGDVILAEPGARIGFAGPEVIKQFLKVESLPEGFQRSETVLKHGFIDHIVRRDELPAALGRLLAMLRAPEAL
ncbi:MAG: acetyl-CoA carboxylase, carboxyltransferase subunit beta [Candidatus Handelsmanbacteria bacterium]|nr:acetyl-CoA carboxylase, carboxyltransferase subunit beta [Candidatus Handelsmanbacteria bacterium]